jgi:dihydrofolate reductase
MDGYIEDVTGGFDWAAPDEQVHAFVNDLTRPIGTHLYGRRMYETMLYWETAEDVAGRDQVEQDFAAIWRAADKIVYSETLETPASAKTRIVREFDAESIRQMKAAAAADMSVAGPQLAGQAIKAGLVDEVQLFVAPVVVGGGKRALPDNVRQDFELLDERRFDNGTVYLRYLTT